MVAIGSWCSCGGLESGSGGIAVQIAERAGGRDKVLEHLGTAHIDADLAALLAVARGGTLRVRASSSSMRRRAGR